MFEIFFELIFVRRIQNLQPAKATSLGASGIYLHSFSFSNLLSLFSSNWLKGNHFHFPLNFHTPTYVLVISPPYQPMTGRWRQPTWEECPECQCSHMKRPDALVCCYLIPSRNILYKVIQFLLMWIVWFSF